MSKFSNKLQEIGLSDKEAAVYVAALELGRSSVQTIAQKAEVKRATAYVAIESLMNNGLMSSTVKGKKQFFFAEGPERLKDFVSRKKAEISDMEAAVDEILPQLETVHQGKDDEQMVKYYIGKKGVLTMIKNMINVQGEDEVQFIYPYDRILEVMSKDELAGMRMRRKKKNIKVSSLYTSDGAEFPPEKGSERIRIKDDEGLVTADIAIYKDQVRFVTLGTELKGIVIKNKEIADTLRVLFKYAFKEANNQKKSPG